MEFLRESQWLVWLGVALVLGVIEIATLDLVFAMLTVAALAAAGASLAGGDFTVQVIVFGVVAAVMLLVARPVALRKLKNTPESHTNVDALAGRAAEVLEVVSARDGRVKLAGETWSARCDDGATYAPGSSVRVVRIDGATAVVAGDGAVAPTKPEGEQL